MLRTHLPACYATAHAVLRWYGVHVRSIGIPAYPAATYSCTRGGARWTQVIQAATPIVATTSSPYTPRRRVRVEGGEHIQVWREHIDVVAWSAHSRTTRAGRTLHAVVVGAWCVTHACTHAVCSGRRRQVSRVHARTLLRP